MKQKQTISKIDLFSYYRLQRTSSMILRETIEQIISTYMLEGTCVVLLTVDEHLFRCLAQCYNDMLTGYRHPRRDSLSYNYAPNDRTLQALKRLFPQWIAPEWKSK